MIDLTIASACDYLRQGAIIAYPTEAVFGLGCCPSNPTALKQLIALKQRSSRKGLIIVAADLQQLQPFLAPLSEQQFNQLNASWPGPITWLCPSAATVDPLLTGHRDSIAVRVSAHPTVQALCDAFAGPIVSTSANLSSEPPARSVAEINRTFINSVVVGVIDESLGDLAKPTQIRELLTGMVLR